jgi:hypothetical protein
VWGAAPQWSNELTQGNPRRTVYAALHYSLIPYTLCCQRPLNTLLVFTRSKQRYAERSVKTLPPTDRTLSPHLPLPSSRYMDTPCIYRKAPHRNKLTKMLYISPFSGEKHSISDGDTLKAIISCYYRYVSILEVASGVSKSQEPCVDH